MEKDKAYISKEEKKIPINDPTGKWSDLTLLPEWGEKHYDVYTVKKHGKWVMLKALRREYADKPEYRRMIEQEFDTRYNLAHPNIVMVNDFEEIPGIGTLSRTMRMILMQKDARNGQILRIGNAGEFPGQKKRS